MCGIAGYTGPKNDQLLSNILKTILFRGPDGNGKYVDPEKVNLCHSRLSIIDLQKGSQPLFYDDCVIIFNGEIYNYLELRDELKIEGFIFKTNSDTEVILACYKHYGEKFVEKLNGMFAICIYDKTNQKVILAVDPFSIKPLYYCIIKNELFFSSTIKSFFCNEDFNRTINIQSLLQTITFRYAIDGNTLFKNIKKIKKQQIFIWDNRNKNYKVQDYNIFNSNKFNNYKSDNDWIDECKFLIDDSLKINLRSDVPIGIFLSSGVDSAGLLHLAKKNNYSNIVAYSYSTGKKNDEKKFVKDISRQYGIETKFVTLDDNEYFNNFDKIVLSMDYPILDSLIFPIGKLCEEASKNHKVVITGEGADEMFGGYFYLETMEKLKKLNSFINPKIFACIANITPSVILNFFFKYESKLGQLGKNRLVDLIKNFNSKNETYINATSLLNNRELKKYTNFREKNNVEVDSLDFKYLQELMINTWLPNQICTKSDQLSMSYGLETRVPFLDKRILELIMKVPRHLITNGSASKIIYRLALKKLGYKQYQKPKKAFYVPLEEGFKFSINKLMKEYLNDRYIKKYNIFNIQFINENKYYFEKGEFLAGKRIVMACIMHRWLDFHQSNFKL